MPRLRFLFFGDSLTQRGFELGGWGAGMTDLYRRTADITLRGFGGYNTRCALHIADDIFPPSAPQPAELVTLWFGANDAAVPDRLGGPQHIPIEEYKQNLLRLIQKIREHGTTYIILLTPPPVGDSARIQHNTQRHGDIEAARVPDRTREHSGLYAAACREVAHRSSLPVVDLWTGLQEYIGWEATFFNDGLHFNRDGQQAVLKLLLEVLDSNIPQLKADKLVPDYPKMEDLDFQNLDKSFAEHAKLHGSASSA
ncbi:hypothetical protein WJX73_009257 [Symbiochloris irregularis]|uniref:SGNH hydrolase-type esterase domain-containing protein n=1 Tax=Symbiochloris irregularis TaxID=706552 RepID=A0AAW1PZ18_9CHLO